LQPDEKNKSAGNETFIIPIFVHLKILAIISSLPDFEISFQPNHSEYPPLPRLPLNVNRASQINMQFPFQHRAIWDFILLLRWEKTFLLEKKADI
jgi:hypothetical protein